MKIYLAASYSRREEILEFKNVIEQIGHTVTSRWILEHRDAYTSHEMRECAKEDIEDIVTADMLIAFTESSSHTNRRGGRHTELGVALGLSMPIIRVGPEEENIFYTLADKRFFYKQDLLTHLNELRDKDE